MTTSILGAGLSPFGLSYAGYGSPSTTNPLNKTILIDDFGNPGQVRLIDPVTKDYRFNSSGRIVGGNGIQQLVYLALLTVRGTSAMTDLGQSFTNVKVIGANYVSLVKGEVNKALASLISQKKIQLIDVIVSNNGNMAMVDIKWKDIATGTEYLNTI